MLLLLFLVKHSELYWETKLFVVNLFNFVLNYSSLIHISGPHFVFLFVTSSNLFHMWMKMAQRMTTGLAHLVLLVKRDEKLQKSIK